MSVQKNCFFLLYLCQNACRCFDPQIVLMLDLADCCSGTAVKYCCPFKYEHPTMAKPGQMRVIHTRRLNDPLPLLQSAAEGGRLFIKASCFCEVLLLWQRTTLRGSAEDWSSLWAVVGSPRGSQLQVCVPTQCPYCFLSGMHIRIFHVWLLSCSIYNMYLVGKPTLTLFSLYIKKAEKKIYHRWICEMQMF